MNTYTDMSKKVKESTRTIKAIFEIQEDSNLAGVIFTADDEKIEWGDLSRLEQIRMLNAWVGHYELFSRFLKEE